MKRSYYIFLVLLIICLNTSGVRAAEANRYETALTPLVETTLSSRIGGYIKEINATEGQTFKKGDVLVNMDCDLHKADLQRAEAELKGAEKVYAAKKKLDQLKSVSKLEVSLSAVDVEKLSAEKRRMQKMVENCQIKAPFSGIVTEMLAKPFQNVTEGEPLLKIMSTESVQLEFYVPSSDVARFTPDLTLDLYINETGKKYKATLVAVVPRIDPVSQTFKVIGRINDPDKSMLPGMSGYITIPGDVIETNDPVAPVQPVQPVQPQGQKP